MSEKVSVLVERVKKIGYRLAHPFFWSKNMIIGMICIQVAMAAFVTMYVSYVIKKPERIYVEKALNSKRMLIKNLKLANTESYIWRPVLKCASVLSEDHYKIHESFQPEDENCIPISFKFSKNSSVSQNKYINDQDKHKIYYQEKTEKPCLICHQNNKKKIVKWVYHTSPETLAHLSENEAGKLIKETILFCFAAMMLFWLVYSLLRFIFYTRGKLNVLALSFLNEHNKFPPKFLKDIGLKQSGFLYAEMNEKFLRGYIPQSVFLKWLDLIIQKKIVKMEHLFVSIKANVMRIGTANNFEGMRISQLIARKAEPGRIIFEQEILPAFDTKAMPEESKTIVWKVRQSHDPEPRKFQFIDLKFESMNQWGEGVASLNSHLDVKTK